MDTITKERAYNPEITIRVQEQTVASSSSTYKIDKGNYQIIKRTFDLVLSTMLILTLLSWLYPILYIIIRLSSKGGALFIQKRVGKHGKIFKCYKFRTMQINNEADRVEAAFNDKRITKVGRILRMTYIDELPQLFNVIKGDMSLVGPRPHMIFHDKQFCNLIHNYKYRHDVLPGITGLAQVKGYNGSVNDYYGIYGRTKLDLFYARNISLLLDMQILSKTLFFVFTNKDMK